MAVWQDIGISTGKFLLPSDEAMLSSWAVVACDQYTSQPQYWHRLDEIIGSRPSSLRLILPEAFLDNTMKIEKTIITNMQDYLESGLIRQAVDGMVLTARTTESGTRLGLVFCLDLEQYDYSTDSSSLIRATEGTVESRIPPRLGIRKKAPLELSHILVLVDDSEKTIIEPVFLRRARLRVLYDIELMQGGGHLSGWAVEDEGLLAALSDALRSLLCKRSKNAPLLAVGDGNHSLAAARAHWLEVKKTLGAMEALDHPARFAMAELTNLQGDALRFEPIHRILYHVEADAVLHLLHDAGAVESSNAPDITVVTMNNEYPLFFSRPLHPLSVGTLQQILDNWTDEPYMTIDYIHGEKALRDLVACGGAVGIILPAIPKSFLFPAITNSGPLPRKTFSMGEAHEKRYYMEARKIIK